MLNTPTPSSALDEVTADLIKAQDAYRAALDAHRTEHPRDTFFSGESADREAREAFERTEDGERLAAAAITAERRRRNALEVSDAITFAGRVFVLADLNQAARGAVYRTAAEHGADTGRWPADVSGELVRFLIANPRSSTFGETAEARHTTLTKVRATVDDVLERFGLDPTQWPDTEIERLALAALRADAFGQLVARARQLDSEWSTRVTANTTKED